MATATTLSCSSPEGIALNHACRLSKIWWVHVVGLIFGNGSPLKRNSPPSFKRSADLLLDLMHEIRSSRCRRKIGSDYTGRNFSLVFFHQIKRQIYQWRTEVRGRRVVLDDDGSEYFQVRCLRCDSSEIGFGGASTNPQ